MQKEWVGSTHCRDCRELVAQSRCSTTSRKATHHMWANCSESVMEGVAHLDMKASTSSGLQRGLFLFWNLREPCFLVLFIPRPHPQKSHFLQHSVGARTNGHWEPSKNSKGDVLFSLPFTFSWKFTMAGVCGNNVERVHGRKEPQTPSQESPQEKSWQTASNMHKAWQCQQMHASKCTQQ